jgi:hypothetical protein
MFPLWPMDDDPSVDAGLFVCRVVGDRGVPQRPQFASAHRVADAPRDAARMRSMTAQWRPWIMRASVIGRCCCANKKETENSPAMAGRMRTFQGKWCPGRDHADGPSGLA